MQTEPKEARERRACRGKTNEVKVIVGAAHAVMNAGGRVSNEEPRMP